MSDTLPAFLLPVIAQLRRRRIQVGIADVHALRLALRAGFGLASRDALRELCVALWAKSPAEAKVVRAAFANVAVGLLADWATQDLAETTPAAAGHPQPGTGESDEAPAPLPDGPGEPGAGEGPAAGTVPLPGDDLRALDQISLRTLRVDGGLIGVPQYPLTSREVAQAWRYLRRPVRSGPAVELDIGATVAGWAKRGVATPPVLVPRRRNAARLLMLIDRQGSMAPFHQYVDYVVGAIRDAGRIDDVRAVYFHDVPGSLPDRKALQEAPDPLGADLDDVLGLISPLQDGTLYDDPGLAAPRPLDEILGTLTAHTAVLVISDAGAARRQFDLIRLLDTIALLKALRGRGAELAWLNPVARQRWARTTAGQVARHVPMFPFTRLGLDQAVDTLRGRPALVERPV
jgi:uncharacterized protein with von Willebrand factor type A (vWA) domain